MPDMPKICKALLQQNKYTHWKCRQNNPGKSTTTTKHNMLSNYTFNFITAWYQKFTPCLPRWCWFTFPTCYTASDCGISRIHCPHSKAPGSCCLSLAMMHKILLHSALLYQPTHPQWPEIWQRLEAQFLDTTVQCVKDCICTAHSQVKKEPALAVQNDFEHLNSANSIREYLHCRLHRL